MALVGGGYGLFAAVVRDFNDGEEACDATLTVTETATGNVYTYYGSTKNEHGHAEIDALYQFLDDLNWNHLLFGNYTYVITCTAKPVCKCCSAVMGRLGIAPGANTYKVNKTMGISYALPPNVRTFLRKRLGRTEFQIIDEFCG
jgi:hypothetical protein